MQHFSPGFANPVHDAQACFRAVLDAMAHPGSLHRAGADLAPPPELCRAAAAVLLTLTDADTLVWVDPAWTAAREWLVFHCAVPLAGTPAQADFVLADPGCLAALATGDDDVPETGATLIWQVAALGRGPALRLDGPGLQRSAMLQIDPQPAGFIEAWAANHARFPQGADLILCCGDLLAALPRTTAIAEWLM